jgi:sorbose reductase
MKGIKGRIHVITGGYSDIAVAAGHFIASEGGTVVLTGRQKDKGEAAAASIREKTGGVAYFESMDVTDPNAVEAAVNVIESKIGPVYGLVASAASSWPGTAFELTPEDWRKTLAVNLDGTWYCTQAFGRRMRGRGGSIVLVSSVCGSKVSWPPSVVSYSVSKAGISHLAALLGVEWASSGIRVNALEPGQIDTERLRSATQQWPDAMAKWLRTVPIGRLISPDEIAATIVFLISDLSSSMTASVLTADGGYSRR